MDTGLRHAGLHTIPAGTVLRLQNAAGRHLSVVHGTVWITQLGDRRDPVLESGASFRFERDGLSLVQPLGGPAQVMLEEGLAPERKGPPVAQSIEERSLQRGRLERYEREAHRLRAEAVAAAFAGAAAWLGHAGRNARAKAQRLARSLPSVPGTASALGGLSDHTLRDLGLRRDRVQVGLVSRICTSC